MKIPKETVQLLIEAMKSLNANNGIKEVTKLTKNLEHLVKNSLAIVSGKYNPELVKKIAKHLKVEPIFLDTENFSNNYPNCERPEKLKKLTFAGKKVFIVTNLQYTSTGSPLEELQHLFDACKSADEIHIILTYMCGKNDITHKPGAVPLLAWACATIKELNPKSINWFDPHHSSQIELFYPIRRRRFYFLHSIIEKFREIGVQQIATTDFGSSKRAFTIANFLGLKTNILFTEKGHNHSSKGKEIEHHRQIGEIAKDVKIIGMADDMWLTGSTTKKACYGIRDKKGSKDIKIYAATAQFDPAENSYKNLKEILENGTLNGFFTTNSNPIPQKFLDLPNFHEIDESKVVADLINALDNNESTGFMFTDN